ncbi:MAG TPA: metabolite traffic protein EboE [Saprospiraceae bacterium]|nr:metabolite traffic protein EboE [Saprospiraceae bacterium]
MKIQNGQLTYCTNIHPGETWPEVFQSLDYCLAVKERVSPDQPFGIGLRLSAQAAQQLGRGKALAEFKNWLEEKDCYVFTMNGFPYGGFHNKVVKDHVHAPDWTTVERLDYTKLLFDQLGMLLPTEMEGGISTSPLSYRFWHKTEEALAAAVWKSTLHLIDLVAFLARLKERTGRSLHLDIEPEPDGILENCGEFIDYYENILLAKGAAALAKKMDISPTQAEDHIREHIQLCYDVCHFAVAYEEPQWVLDQLQAKGIKVGKIQISAAIKSQLNEEAIEDIKSSLLPYNESTYLHQTVFATKDQKLARYPDLGPALEQINNPDYTELRTHFHVPIFTDSYGALRSTNDEIEKVLKIWNAKPFSRHLEIETYTWGVLPANHQLDLTASISRELSWVLERLEQ